MFADIKYAIRTLTHTPVFTTAVVLTLALGIGANTIVFSVVNALLLRPLPVEQPDKLVQIYTGSSHVSYPNYRDFDAQANVFTDIAAHRFDSFNMEEDDIPERVSGEYVTGNYFAVLGVGAVRGRVLRLDDDVPSAAPVVVISEELWKGRLSMAPDIIGKTLRLNGHLVTIVGMTSAEFRGPYPVGRVPQIWVPVSSQRLLLPGPDRFNDRNNRWLSMIARLRPGVTQQEAQAAVTTIAQNLKQSYVNENFEFDKTTIYGLTGIYAYRGVSFAPLVLLFLALLSLIVFMVLLIACANVANLFLARGWSRQRELAIRIALGAKRSRILRQLLTESFSVALVGGGFGCLLAFIGVMLIQNLQSSLPMPLGMHLTIDRAVLLYTVSLSMIAGIIFGIAPAWQGSRGNFSAMLGHIGVTAGRGRQRLKDALVVAEVALCCILLVFTGLFIRSLQRAASVDPGFETRQIVTVGLDLQTSGYTAETGPALLRRATEEIQSLPGVRSVSVGRLVPLSLNRDEFRVWSGEDQGVSSMVLVNGVGPRYFSTMRIPLVAGREFTAADTTGAPQVVIVSEALAKRFWPDNIPIGKTLRSWGGRPGELGPPMQVIGVARDSKYYTLGEEPQAVLYQAYAQTSHPSVILHVAANTPAASLIAPVKRTLLAIDSTLLLDVNTMEENLQIGLLPARIAIGLTAPFGLLGLVLASAGISALVAYSVGQRKKEIGIRIAVGARRTDVLRMILRKSVMLAISGMAIGFVLALGLSQLLRSFLTGVVPADPVTFGFAAIVILAVTAAASWFPARGATKISPMDALRNE